MVPTRKLGCSNFLVTVLLRVDMWPGIVQVEVPASISSSVYCESKQCLSVCCTWQDVEEERVCVGWKLLEYFIMQS